MKTTSLTVTNTPRGQFVTITIRNPFNLARLAAFYRRALTALNHAEARETAASILLFVAFAALVAWTAPILIHVFQ